MTLNTDHIIRGSTIVVIKSNQNKMRLVALAGENVSQSYGTGR